MSLKTVECCNIEQVGRVFAIEPKNKMQRVFVYLDRCQNCGQSKAIIKDVGFDGKIKNTTVRSGRKAQKLYDRFSRISSNFEYKVQKGSKSNMWWFYFDGIDQWIKDFNGAKILKIN